MTANHSRNVKFSGFGINSNTIASQQVKSRRRIAYYQQVIVLIDDLL